MRTKNIVTLALSAVSAFAGIPTNSVTITSPGAAQTGHPVTFARAFAQGEIATYPKPLVDGSAPSLWQSDQIRRWRDGRASCTITAITNTTPPYVTCANHGFRSGDWVTISGTTDYDGKHKIVYWTRDKFILSRASAAGAKSSGTATGPGPGSVKWAIISFITNLPASPTALTVTFANSATRTSDAAYESPTEAQILAFASADWNAAIKYEQTGTTTRTIDARTMIDAGHYRLRLDGPAVWEVIAEDRTATQTYDFGITCSANCTTTYETATWADDGTSKAAHPYFILRMYAGWTGVKVRYVHEQTNSVDFRDQRFNITLLSDAALSTTQWTGTPTIYGRQRITWPVDSSKDTWTGDYSGYWDGTQPVLATIDHNANYLRYTKQVPFYDTTAVVSDANVAYDWGVWQGASRIPGTGSGNARKDYGAAGLDPHIGLFPRWHAIYTIRPSNRQLEEISAGNGFLIGNVPAHWREFSASANYSYFHDLDGDGTARDDTTGNASTVGRIVSMDARPTMLLKDDVRNHCEVVNYVDWSACTKNEDKMLYGTPFGSTSHGWSNGERSLMPSHSVEAAYIPYLLTGDYFLEEELQFWGNWHMFYQSTALDSDPAWPWERHGSTAFVGSQEQARAAAWSLRSMLMAYEASPDGSPEKEYFYSKINNNLQAFEGVLKLVQGDYWNPTTTGTGTNPCPNYAFSGYTPNVFTPYCLGSVSTAYRAYGGGSKLGHLNFTYKEGGDYRSCYWQESDIAGSNPACDMFATHYLWQVLGLADQWLGIPTIMERVGRWIVGIVSHPDGSVYRSSLYSYPIASGSEMLHTFGRAKEVFSTWAQDRATFYDSYHGGDNLDVPTQCYGYTGYFRGALSFFHRYHPMGMSGLAAWDAFGEVYWLSDYVTESRWPYPGAIETGTCANMGNVAGGVSYPNHSFSPGLDPVKDVRVTNGDTFAVIEYTKPRADEACTVNGTTDGTTTSRKVKYVLTGLTASTTGSATIACASDPYGTTAAAWATLATLSSTASYSWTVAGTVRLNYGATSSLGTSTDYADCSTGCSVTLNKGLWYVQIERQSGGIGEVRAVVVK